MSHLYRCSCGELSTESICTNCGKDLADVNFTVREAAEFYQPFIGTYSILSPTIVRRNINKFLKSNNISIAQDNMRYINGGYAYTYPLWVVTEALEEYKRRISTLIRIPPHKR